MTDLEIKLINQIRNSISGFVDSILEIITIVGEQNVLILILLILYFIFSKKEAQKIAFSIFTSLLINNSFKGLIKRTRPFKHPLANYEPARVETATGYSFPSGHSQNAASSYTSIALNYKKRWLWILVSVIISLVGLSRICLGVHYPTDVLAGIALGVGCAFLGAYLFERFGKNFKGQVILYIIVILLFLPFLFIFWKNSYVEMELLKDFYTAYAFFLGYVSAVILEHKFVNFNCNNKINIKLVRAIIAMIIALGMQFGLKVIFPKESIIFDMIRYFLTAFAALGIFPILAKKWLFKIN